MAWADPDLYYDPREFGLTPMGEINWFDGGYEYDFTVVWRHDDGRYYMGRDSGCSCGSPFEGFNALADADGPFTRTEVLDQLSAEIAGEQTHSWHSDREAERWQEQYARLVEKVLATESHA